MRIVALWLGILACGPSGPVDTDVVDTDVVDTDVVDTDVDTDTETDGVDTDVDTDTDTDTDTVPPESKLLEDVGPTTSVGDDAVDRSREWAFRITPGAADLEVFEVWLAGTGDASTDLVLEVFDGATGVPAGTPMLSYTVTGATIPTTPGWVTVTPLRPLTVGDGPLFVALRVTGGTASFSVYPQATTTGALATREPPGAWEAYGKPYDWPHRVWGSPK